MLERVSYTQAHSHAPFLAPNGAPASLRRDGALLACACHDEVRIIILLPP